MAKEKLDITINNFESFEQIVIALNKVVEGMKVSVNETGMTIYTRNTYARFSTTSNCITSKEDVDMNFNELITLIKNLKLVRTQCKDMTKLKCFYQEPFLHFKSKDIKTKIGTVKERVIQNFVTTEVTTELKPIFEFNTTSETLKMIGSNKFIFADIESARIYLITNDKELHNNTVYAELNNRLNPLSSSLTLKLGDITLNEMGGRESDVIIDFDRLRAFNLFNDTTDVKIQLMDKNILVSETSINSGDEGQFTKLTVYNSLRKS